MANAFSEVGDRLADLSEAAAECRMLRHAWPRKRDPNYRALTSIAVLARNRAGKPTRIERRMACAGGCGVVKTVTMSVDPKSMRTELLDSRYDYSQTNGQYLIRTADMTGHRYTEQVDRNEVGYVLLTRLYPDLSW